MANATPRDTRAGFDIFRSSGGSLSLDDLNALLYEAGYGPVAARTLRHYQNLIEAGFNRYVSINRFDVARAAVPFDNASAKGRYGYVDVDLGVRVVFAKTNKLMEAFGRATEIGEVGALLRFEEQEVVEGLRKLKPQPGDMVTLRYLEAGRTVGGRVVEADVKADPAVIEVEYAQLISIASVGVGDPLPSVEARFVLSGPEDELKTLDVASRRLYQFFELIEGVRTLANEAGGTQDDPVYVQPAVLQSLSVASPADLVVQIAEQAIALFPWGLAAGVLRIIYAVPEKRKTWYEGTGQKKDNQLKDLEIREKQFKADLQDLEAARLEAEAGLRTDIIERVRETFSGTRLTDLEIARAVDESVLPPLRALGRSGIDELVPFDDDPTARTEAEQAHP